MNYKKYLSNGVHNYYVTNVAFNTFVTHLLRQYFLTSSPQSKTKDVALTQHHELNF